MARLKHHNSAPPGNWVYRQSKSALTLKSDSFESLVAKVAAHRKYWGIHPQDTATVAIEVERQICSRLDQTYCIAEPGDDWVPVQGSGHVTLSDILAFSKTMLSWLASGRQLVPMEEAEKRRKTCLDCPLNRQPSGCKCGALYRMIAASVPKERQFEDLHVCGVCHCTLKAKVHLPLEVIEAGLRGRNLRFPANCWLAKEAPDPQKGSDENAAPAESPGQADASGAGLCPPVPETKHAQGDAPQTG